MYREIQKKGHSRVSIQNLPPHVLTWNFCHRFASMWSKISPNDNPRNSFFSELWRGKEKFKKWFFLKTAWPILMNKIYVVATSEAIPRKKNFWKKLYLKKIFEIFEIFFLKLCSSHILRKHALEYPSQQIDRKSTRLNSSHNA